MVNKFVSIFFANGCHQIPSKTILFSRDSPSSPWHEPPREYPLPCGGDPGEVLRNAFVTKSSQGAECLLLFRDEHCLAFKLENMEEIAKVSYKNDVLSVLIQNYTTTPDF